MIESFQDYRLRHDIARIVAVGAAYVTVVIETIGTELGRLDEVRKIIQEFSEINPGSGADPQQPSPPGVA